MVKQHDAIGRHDAPPRRLIAADAVDKAWAGSVIRHVHVVASEEGRSGRFSPLATA